MTEIDDEQKLLNSLTMAKQLMTLANELEKQQPKKPTKVTYVGIFVDKDKLTGMIPPKFPKDQGGKVPADHVTLQFSPSPEKQTMYEAMIGQIVPINLVSVFHDDRIQAVSVSLPPEIPCSNKHPHITISHQNGVPPVESNKLLERASSGAPDVQTENVNQTIMGVIDFFPRTSTTTP